eukprot:gene14355-16939_t
MMLLEASLYTVDEEIAALQQKRQRILQGVEVVAQQQHKLNVRMEACKASVLARWQALQTRFGLVENEPPSMVALLPVVVMINILENLSFKDINFAVSRNESKPLKIIPASFWSSPILPPSQAPQTYDSPQLHTYDRIEHNWWTSVCRSKRLPGHSDWITCMQFDGKMLVTGSWDGSIKLWNIDTYESHTLSTTDNGHNAGITCVQFKNNRLISGSSDSTLRIWDLSTSECLHVLRGHTDGVSCLTIIDDATVASGSLDNTVNLWSIETGKLLHSFSTHNSGITCLAYKNNLLISGAMSGTINVIDIPSRIVLQTLHGHSDRVTSIQWWDGPHGERIISSSWDYTIRIWNIQSGKSVHVLSGHSFRVRCTYVRGNILVSGSWDTTVRVWDLLTGKCIHTLQGHSFNVWGVQFEGKRLVTAGWDRKVKVWDLESGKLLYTLDGHTESIICLQFKGSKLVTGAKEIIVWDFDI